MTDQRRQDEFDRRLTRVLDADGAQHPLRPMWPEVARRRACGGGFDLVLASASAAAVAVGFMIGALTFNGNGEVPIAEQTTEIATLAIATDWSDTGPRIDQLYLLEAPAEAEASETP